MTAFRVLAQVNDTVPLLTDCSASPSEPAEIVATIHQSDAVRVRYSLGGNAQTCYAVSATLNGKAVEGYLLGNTHRDATAFELEARSRIPSIPDPPKPDPAPAKDAKDPKDTKDAKDKTLVAGVPQSFAGLSGTSPEGRRVSLASINSPTVVLYFWSANNQKSIREVDAMESVYNKYHAKGVGLVGVVSGSSAANVRKVLRDEEVLWPQILDTGAIASQYPVTREARYFILDRQRNAVAALKSVSEVQRELMKMRQPSGRTE